MEIPRTGSSHPASGLSRVGMLRQAWTAPGLRSVACWTMSEDDQDPIASTQMFQAFVDRHRDEPEQTGSPLPWIVAAAVVLAMVAALAWFLLG